MPLWVFRYKLEPLCQLPNPSFEAKVLFGDILSFLVCRQNVAKFGAPFTGDCRVAAYTGWLGVMVRVKKSHAVVQEQNSTSASVHAV